MILLDRRTGKHLEPHQPFSCHFFNEILKILLFLFISFWDSVIIWNGKRPGTKLDQILSLSSSSAFFTPRSIKRSNLSAILKYDFRRVWVLYYLSCFGLVLLNDRSVPLFQGVLGADKSLALIKASEPERISLMTRITSDGGFLSFFLSAKPLYYIPCLRRFPQHRDPKAANPGKLGFILQCLLHRCSKPPPDNAAVISPIR